MLDLKIKYEVKLFHLCEDVFYYEFYFRAN